MNVTVVARPLSTPEPDIESISWHILSHRLPVHLDSINGFSGLDRRQDLKGFDLRQAGQRPRRSRSHARQRGQLGAQFVDHRFDAFADAWDCQHRVNDDEPTSFTLVGNEADRAR